MSESASEGGLYNGSIYVSMVMLLDQGYFNVIFQNSNYEKYVYL